MWDWDDGHMDDGWGAAMAVGMVGIWIVIAAGIVIALAWAVRSGNSGRAGTAPPQPPPLPPPTGAAAARARDILAERLARGEIDTAEYRERLAALDDPGRS